MLGKFPHANTVRRRRLVRVIAGLGVALATAFASSAVAPAKALADVHQNTIMRNWATGVCLDSDNHSVYVGGCNGGIYQDWYIGWYGTDPSGNSIVLLIHSNTDLCLQGSSEPSNTSSVAIVTCDFTNNAQLWTWTGDSTVGHYRNAGSGACLDTNGTSAYTQGCNGGQNQAWRQGF